MGSGLRTLEREGEESHRIEVVRRVQSSGPLMTVYMCARAMHNLNARTMLPLMPVRDCMSEITIGFV
jgi:hypothetical protein